MDGFIAEVVCELSVPVEPAAASAGSAAAPKEAPPVEAPPAGRGAKKGKPPERDPAKEAETKAKRRRKYVQELKESRDALSHSCTFQDSLHDVPAVGVAVSQTEEISASDKRTRLEVKHAASLSGRFPGNAPVVLTFSLPDVVSTPAPTEPPPEASPATSDQTAAMSSEERPQT
jgi:hypothetical protein